MKAITDWFNGKLDYDKGVQIYCTLGTCRPMTLRQLQKGKSNHNMAVLIKELRKAGTSAPLIDKEPSTINHQPATKEPELPDNTTDTIIAEHYNKKHLKEVSKKSVFGSIRYGELPAELRARYQEAANMFYQMCDLKFALNDLPDDAADAALAIQLQLEEIDQARENIWTELHHWQNHKVLLPTEPDPLDSKTDVELYQIKQNTKSQITKLNQRLDGYYTKLADTTDHHESKKIEEQINRSEKRLHKHRLNINKIDEII